MEFLSQTDGDSVLHLGAPDLDHMVEFFCFLGKCLVKPQQFFLQDSKKPERSHLPGGWDHVVGGLAAVHMIVGIHYRIVSLLPAQDLNSPVGDHFVGVHIKRRAGAALDGVNNKILVKFPFDDLIAGLDNGSGPILVQDADLTVGDGSRLLDIGQTVDDLRVHVKPGDMEILCRPQALYAVVNVLRDLLFSNRIFFCPVICSLIHDNPPFLFCFQYRPGRKYNPIFIRI